MLRGQGNLYDGIKLEELAEERRCFKYVVDKMQKTICHRDVAHYNIKKIFRIANNKNWPRYVNRREVIKNEMEGSWVEEKRLFHGSPHAQEIATDGFDRGYAKDSGMFGKGVYFAENSSKSNNYAYGNFSPCKDHTNRQCELCTLCKVALGKVFETTSTVKSCPRGYHSVKALPQRGFLNHVEYIIYNDDQVYPRFLIEYTTTYTAQVVPRPNPQIDPFFRQFLRLKRMMNKPQQNRQNTKGCIIL